MRTRSLFEIEREGGRNAPVLLTALIHPSAGKISSQKFSHHECA